MAKYFLWEDVGKAEPIIREFCLVNSDTVRFTRITPHVNFKKIGTNNDEKFIKNMYNLSEFFLQKTVNNIRYENIEQMPNSKYEHYFYRLSTKMKDLINNQTILYDPVYSEKFYCLDDPLFYKSGKLLGGCITHEPYFILDIDESQKATFEKRGLWLNETKPEWMLISAPRN